MTLINDLTISEVSLWGHGLTDWELASRCRAFSILCRFTPFFNRTTVHTIFHDGDGDQQMGKLSEGGRSGTPDFRVQTPRPSPLDRRRSITVLGEVIRGGVLEDSSITGGCRS